MQNRKLPTWRRQPVASRGHTRFPVWQRCYQPVPKPSGPRLESRRRICCGASKTTLCHTLTTAHERGGPHSKCRPLHMLCRQTLLCVYFFSTFAPILDQFWAPKCGRICVYQMRLPYFV
ncbi:unnamed protein product [Protopolystoma xenopodis]|uniref:Uncharacterized protein n=1 Tax=Protopolystoma xenopodis TaxID=117903 RepID=A0A448XE21_9PLAT|nr:unnamed protein product [Protopolystoma xenopodis]